MSKREQTSIDLQLSQRSALKAQHMLSTPTQVFTLILPNETFSEDCVYVHSGLDWHVNLVAPVWAKILPLYYYLFWFNYNLGRREITLNK